MTYREKVTMECPEALSTRDYGGVVGCPASHRYSNIFEDILVEPGLCTVDPRVISHEVCTACWNREIKEKEKDKVMSTITKKTKQELLEEIDSLKKEVEKLKRYETYSEGAEELSAFHSSLVDAGFSDERAFQILLSFINNFPKLRGNR